MKKSVKIFVCIIAVSTALQSCLNTEEDEQGNLSSSSSGLENPSSSSFEMKVPQMDERVVAYIHSSGKTEIITDMDKLKELFKTALNEKNLDPECDYFAISAFASDGATTYFVVSKDQSADGDFLALYHIYPNLEQPNAPYERGSSEIPVCMYDASIMTYGFLICDKEGGLKDRVNFSPPVNYFHPDWDCWSTKPYPKRPEFFEFKK